MKCDMNYYIREAVREKHVSRPMHKEDLMKRDIKGRLEEEAIDLKRKRKIGLFAEVKEMESFHWVVRLDLGLP